MARRRRRRPSRAAPPCCASKPTRPRPTSRLHPRVDSRSRGRVGDTFACGERIGWFLDDGEEPPGCRRRSPPPPQPRRSRQPPAPAPAQRQQHPPLPRRSGGRIIASPMAKRLAKERGIDLRAGPRHRARWTDRQRRPRGCRPQHRPRRAPRPRCGQVDRRGHSCGSPTRRPARCRADGGPRGPDRRPRHPRRRRPVRPHADRHVTRDRRSTDTCRRSAADDPALPPAMQEPTSITKLSGMRGTIAKRMHESLSQMAQLTLFMDADLDAVVADRARAKGRRDEPRATPTT